VRFSLHVCRESELAKKLEKATEDIVNKFEKDMAQVRGGVVPCVRGVDTVPATAARLGSFTMARTWVTPGVVLLGGAREQRIVAEELEE
jgi:hypothetical protein